MDIFTVAMWIIAVVMFAYSMIKDKTKTIKSMKMAKNMMKNMMGEIVGILFIVGMFLTFVPVESIKGIVGQFGPIVETGIFAIFGGITLIPAFVAFPLAGALHTGGVNTVSVAAFLTTLTMVGLATFPLEKNTFGAKFAVYRNLLSFGFAIAISILMGVII